MDKNKIRLYLPYLNMTWKVTKWYNSCFIKIQEKYNLKSNERDVLLFLYNNNELKQYQLYG